MRSNRQAQNQVAQINVRIDRKLKDEGDAVLAEAGLSPTQIVRDLWGKLAQRGTSLEEVIEALGASGYSDREQAVIDAKLAVVDRVAHRRDALADALGLSTIDMPLYPDGYDWHERVRSEHDRKSDRRGV